MGGWSRSRGFTPKCLRSCGPRFEFRNGKRLENNFTLLTYTH